MIYIKAVFLFIWLVMTVDFVKEVYWPSVPRVSAAGITTVASCCGHLKMPGDITLEDGRILKILF